MSIDYQRNSGYSTGRVTQQGSGTKPGSMETIVQAFRCSTLSLIVLTALGSELVLAQASFVEDGKAGFVVSEIQYALAEDAEQTGACPNGMTAGYQNMGNVFVGAPQLQRNEGEKEDAYIQRIFTTAFSDDNIKNLCLNPELGEPDPNYQTVSGKNVPVYGIDLDGDNSQAGGTCPHTDFTGVNGETGVDNQFFRAVGCSNSYQSTGQSNGWNIEMLTGAWGILITLDGVDDIHNDDSVEVGIYANADPIQLSPNREPLEFSTYAIEQDPRYQATAKGKIVNGVLTTEPVDVRIHKITNAIHLERPLEEAVLQMTIGDDGILDGYLAGYTPVEAMYDLQYGFRNGLDAKGEPAAIRLRAGSSIGQAFVLGHSCNGAYYALHDLADHAPDPETGKCTSISTQYRVKAIPAFVVDVETQSINEDLDKAGYGRGY